MDKKQCVFLSLPCRTYSDTALQALSANSYSASIILEVFLAGMR